MKRINIITTVSVLIENTKYQVSSLFAFACTYYFSFAKLQIMRV